MHACILTYEQSAKAQRANQPPPLLLFRQELATSTFVQNMVEMSADKSNSAIKYKQVLAEGGNGKNWLWYDFELGAWKLGSGLITDTGLLLEVASDSFEVG